MAVTAWEHLYQEAYKRGQERLDHIPGVACAFHSVLDGVLRINPETIRLILDENESLKQAALEGCKGNFPNEIHTPEDFIRGLFHSLDKGAALQLMIRSEDTYQWALRAFGTGDLRLGGTSGNMGRALAPLGIPVTVYANPLTVELADLFGNYDNLKVISRQDHNYVLKKPKEAATEHGVFAIHWILEYSSDFELDLDGYRVAPGRANRYIPAWNPRNNQFKMSDIFAEGFLSLIDSYSHLLFSGFHILSEKYPDSSTCEDVIKPIGQYLDQVCLSSSELKIHLEMASIASPKVRGSILQHIIPKVHSLGLNETELPLLLESIGKHEMADSLWKNPAIHEYVHGLYILLSHTKLQRIHFHNFGYYLCLEQQEWSSPEKSRDALLFAAIMAAARAKDGLFSSRKDIAKGLTIPVSDKGLNHLNQLGEELQVPGLAEDGIGKYKNLNLAAIPAKLVESPLFTVGLGDTISSGAFLTE